MITVRLATEADVLALAELLTDATNRKQGYGDTSWGSEAFTNQEVLDMLHDGQLFVAVQGDQLVGTFMTTPVDERIWGARGHDGTALYVHRMATSSKTKGQSIGSELLNWLANKAKEEGLSALRLDCGENTGLCNYYQRQGFKELERKSVPAVKSGIPPYKAALFERKVV
jgi:protein-tyrosine phosphatase